jgi:hypothetical protein
MLKRAYLVFPALLLVLIVAVSHFPQTILTHNTTSMAVSMYDNGYIGHNFDATTGSGVTFGGPDAMYTGGVIVGNSLTTTVGLVGSFTSASLPVMKDWTTVTPFGAFSSLPNFNQVATCMLNDNGAPVANKLGITVEQKSLSNTGDKFVFLQYKVTNASAAALNGLYVGLFADWDVGVANYALNRGGYDATRKLVYQYENGGAVDSRYYGFVALNGLAGARVTANSAFGAGSGPVRDSIFYWMSTFFNEPILANGDMRSILGSGPYNLAVGASQTVYFAVVAGTNLVDLQTNATAAINKYNSSIVPVELTSFTASTSNGSVNLQWRTATETNNRIFEIERKSENTEYLTVGFVNGQGTTTQPHDYTFSDNSVIPGSYSYRLKQIDYDGRFSYSNVVNVEITAPTVFQLSQNYPNPFNPSTTISYSLAQAGNVRLAVYNTLGQEITTLVNEFKESGNYQISFDAVSLSSGVYLYKLETPNFVQIKKMVVNK